MVIHSKININFDLYYIRWDKSVTVYLERINIINSMKLKSFEFNDDDLNISLTFVEENEISTELIYDVNVTR